MKQGKDTFLQLVEVAKASIGQKTSEPSELVTGLVNFHAEQKEQSEATTSDKIAADTYHPPLAIAPFSELRNAEKKLKKLKNDNYLSRTEDGITTIWIFGQNKFTVERFYSSQESEDQLDESGLVNITLASHSASSPGTPIMYRRDILQPEATTPTIETSTETVTMGENSD